MLDRFDPADMFAGNKRHRFELPRLKLTYAWLRPFEGASVTEPNRLEVVFSPHDRVALQQDGRTYDVEVEAGGFYVIGQEPTTLLNILERSDRLEIYPDMALLHGIAGDTVELTPTLGRVPGKQQFRIDGVMLGLAHVLRQMCLGVGPSTPIEVSTIEHMVAARVTGITGSGGQLSARALKRTIEHIEATLDQSPTLDDLAAEACLSPYHFARAFRRSTGHPPHRYVLARKIDHAKNRLLRSGASVAEIAASLGFDNLHHFRRQFRRQFGVQPGELRRAAA